MVVPVIVRWPLSPFVAEFARSEQLMLSVPALHSGRMKASRRLASFDESVRKQVLAQGAINDPR